MEGKNYTVMELAEQIGVPRTTINDWLARYSIYIDTIVQGKRKVYPESALNVLREVAALRNAGKAFAEIETELSSKHPIQAVPLPQEESKSAEAKPETPSGEAVPDKEKNSGNEGFALIARQQSEEIGRLIGESFRSMDQRIQELEALSSAQRRMSYVWIGICVLFLIFLAGGGYLALDFMKQAKAENQRLQNQQLENTAKLTALKEQSVNLIAGNQAFQANITRLESELKQQKKEFEQNIRNEQRRLTELHKAKEKSLLTERDKALVKIKEQETRLALEKEKFAAERLKLLKQLNDLKAGLPEAGQNEKQPAKKPDAPAGKTLKK